MSLPTKLRDGAMVKLAHTTWMNRMSISSKPSWSTCTSESTSTRLKWRHWRRGIKIRSTQILLHLSCKMDPHRRNASHGLGGHRINSSQRLPKNTNTTEEGSFSKSKCNLYILADTYNVPALKVYAVDKLKLATHRSRAFDVEELGDAITLLWDNIQSPNDIRMKEAIAQVVFLNLDCVETCGAIAERMPEAGHLGHFVIAAAKEYHAQISTLEEKRERRKLPSPRYVCGLRTPSSDNNVNVSSEDPVDDYLYGYTPPDPSPDPSPESQS